MTTDVKKHKYNKFKKEDASTEKKNLNNSLKILQNHFNDKYHSK